MSAPSANLLAGRIAVITGAASGIGLAIANRYAEQSASLALIDLNQDRTTAAAESISRRTGARTIGIAADVSDEKSMQRALALVQETLGTSDIVVPNAGILVLKDALDITVEEFDRVLRINLTGSFLTAKVFGQAMVQANRPGSIIFTSSLFGKRGGRGNGAYSASKFGLIGLAQSMAAELAPAGIRVNVVCPGQIDSDMLSQLFDDRARDNSTTPEHERDIFTSRIPVGRLGSPGDVADTFLYLASDLSAYVTGQDITVDGGWSVG
ncbi:SDR family oxidoreductase [Nakamurella antarctica]|uniref:SDR family oxidoreductase n=1 Tax=Nakamurella antarctica TaxID=1902245 RepID=A0A3G8ZHQ3_9ACTN|nr:SDR family NAD(P)-dependent oxidoreductase [Nakamurella antarctica]AZI56902.1 SDR family oxidoreductase [Nakamurella antarctica]